MLNKDFYPTPKKLISKMIAGLDFGEIGTILEPSAGKGDICDYVKTQHERTQIDVIEIEADLQTLLKGKGYNLVFDDFLNFQTFKKYDLIFANFPFSNGDEHLQKAIELQERYGGGIACLVNAETLKNPYTNLRKSLVEKLNKYGASIEYLENQFIDAERKTGVEVALIKLAIPDNNKSFLILENLKKSEDIKVEEKLETHLMEKDLIKSLIARFNIECKLGINLITEYFALKPYLADSLKKTDEKDYSNPLIELKIRDADSYHNNYINEYIKGLRTKYWQLLFSYDTFTNKYTSNIQKELSNKLSLLRNFDFNQFNIDELKKELNKSLSTGIEDAILQMFDQFSQQFSYFTDGSKNIHYYNGWKTNKAHKVNKKIILPINGFSSYSWKRDKIDDYYIKEKTADMIKVFNYLAGELTDVQNTVSLAIREANANYSFNKIPFHYFEATFYKKGTCHITFLDDELLKKFNIYGSQRKGWLPPSYGKRVYEDMSQEEQRVVDEFQGKEDYAKVMQKKDYYLVTTNQLLLA